MVLDQIIKETSYLQEFLTNERLQKIERVLLDRTRHMTLVLEDIYHAHNVSAIVRTCDCFGIQDLHVIENVKRNRINKCVTQGSGKWITIHKYYENEDNTVECLENLKDRRFKIVATALTDKPTTELEDLSIKEEKLALCFGCEELGLSQKALEMADYTVKIPMYGFTQSFNISVTAAMCLQILTKKMRKSNINWRLKENDMIQLKHKWIKSSVKNCEMILERLK